MYDCALAVILSSALLKKPSMYAPIQRILSQACIIFIAAVTVASCGYKNGLGRNEMLFASPVQMAKLSDKVWVRLSKQETFLTSGEDYDHVVDVANRILEAAYYKPEDWDVVVSENKMTFAYALPNKRLVVSSGLLRQTQSDDQLNDAQLAAVIGNLVAHVNYSHLSERYSQSPLARDGLTARRIDEAYEKHRDDVEDILGIAAAGREPKPFSREHSLTADKFSIRYMTRAGYDPQEAVAFWTNLAQTSPARPVHLAIHPVDNARLRHLSQEIEFLSK